MRQEILKPLARLVEAVGVTATEGIAFQALCVGETPMDQWVSLSDLLALVEAARIGTQTRYTVRASG